MYDIYMSHGPHSYDSELDIEIFLERDWREQFVECGFSMRDQSMVKTRVLGS